MNHTFAILAFAASTACANAQQPTQQPDSLRLDTLSFHELKEVVVKGKLPYTRLKGDAMVTRITGSVLEKAGSARDVLGKVPGMIKKGDELEVIGRGKPLYYINGRKVHDQDELKRLMSDEIANIEVITNPGAIYDATISAVVKIKTVKKRGDGFGFATFAKTEQSLRTGKNDPEAQVDFNYRKGNLDIFGSVKEWEFRTNQNSDLGQTTSNAATGDELFRYDGNIRHLWRGVGTHLTGGFNWQISDKHSLGAKVDYTLQTTVDQSERLHMDKFELKKLTESVKSNSKQWSDNPDNILVNGYYNGTIGKLNIDFNTDMFFLNNNTHQTALELATTNNRDITTLTTSKNNMVATKLVLSYPIWKGNLSFGTEETFINRKDLNESEGTGLPNSQSKVKDNTYAAFAQYGVAFSQKTQGSVGLRYEHAYFDYKDVLTSADNLTRSYDNVFPSASVSTMLGKVRMSLSYSNRTKRPSLWQLGNSMIYHNRYVYQQGNPKLKPSIENSLSLVSMFDIFTVGATYSKFTNQICSWSEQVNDEGTIRVSYKGLDKPQRQINLFATANKTWGCYTASWTGALIKQWLTLDFDNGQRSFNKPMWVFNANNTVRLKHDWQLELNSEFHSKSHFSNVELKSNYWNLEAVVQKSFFRDKALTLRLKCEDIMQKARENVFIDYGSYHIYQTNIMDTHRLVLSLRYNFNTSRSKYKGTGAGQEARSRIGK